MRRGFGLVEIVVAVGIITFALVGLITVSHSALRMVLASSLESRASFLLEEGVEAVKNLRDLSWATNITPLAASSTYYVVFNQSWALAPSNPGAVDGIFTRTVVFQNVYRRNSDDDIVDVSSPDPKTLDSDTKKVSVSVSWNSSNQGVKTRTISTYIGDIFNN